jgi:hypothetical protein
MGSHHLEYGFPSTHSANSVSIAFFLFAYVYDLAYRSSSTTSSPISPTTFAVLTVLLGFYTFSIVFGRLYMAMHSFADCAFGVILGIAIWWAYSSWDGIPITLALSSPLSFFVSSAGGDPPALTSYTIHLGRGLGLDQRLYNWTINGGWEVPVILVSVCLLLVNQHPQPVDDCPCFEDAIAMSSVLFGALVGRWMMLHSEFGDTKWHAVMPGSGWLWDSALSGWVQVERGWNDILLWWGIAILKMTLGKL